MVSAGDFAYIPVVVFTSYFGGKGNRARWIGGGCILISIANLMIASSNFLFPVEKFDVNDSYIKPDLTYEINRYVLNATFSVDSDQWFYNTIKDFDVNKDILNAEALEKNASEYFHLYKEYCDENAETKLCQDITETFISSYMVSPDDLSSVRIVSSLPYAFCHRSINSMRQNHIADECKQEKQGLGPFIMIFSGLLVLGVGRTMPFSLGLPLMDDNVKKTNLPLYFACMFFVKILGPVIGLLVGSKLNSIYYTFSPPEGLRPEDPMWIGCWWLGFLIFGCVLFFPSVALFFFPSDDLEEKDEETVQNPDASPMLESAPKKTKKLNLRDRHVKNDDHTTLSEKVGEFKVTVKALFKNPIFVGAMLGRIVDVLAFKGFFVFLGKYLEIQFGVPQHRIQKWQAGSGIIGFAAGVMIGSIAMKKFRLQGRKAATWVAVCSMVAAFLSFLNGGVGCQSVIHLIKEQAQANNFTFPSCRPDCMCDQMPFYPVCNTKGEVFYSPCHAGCPLQNPFHKNDMVSFEGCDCAGTEDLSVSRANCETDHCNSQFKLYFLNQAIGAIFGGMGVVPGMLIILRAVPPEHRSISLGFNGLLVSLLATLPSPIFWGKIIDMSCVMWQNICGNTGACPIYDTDGLRIRLHFIYGGLRVFSLLSDIWVIYWAKGLKLVDEEEDEEEKEKEAEQDASTKVITPRKGSAMLVADTEYPVKC
ncbi:unnamed protein product [Auanema sp. JU1783]|nr:unnamed protein product [Auanema sp. JU1783]